MNYLFFTLIQVSPWLPSRRLLFFQHDVANIYTPLFLENIYLLRRTLEKRQSNFSLGGREHLTLRSLSFSTSPTETEIQRIKREEKLDLSFSFCCSISAEPEGTGKHEKNKVKRKTRE